MKLPENATPPGAVHVPPTCGAPPKEFNSGVAGLVMQRVSAPLLPALGGCTVFTVTVLLTLTQGSGTAMVYV